MVFHCDCRNTPSAHTYRYRRADKSRFCKCPYSSCHSVVSREITDGVECLTKDREALEVTFTNHGSKGKRIQKSQMPPNPKTDPPQPLTGLFTDDYFATRSLDSDVPIAVKAAAIWLEEVTVVNLSAPLAQYCRTVEVGSPLVLTCIV